MLDGLRECYRTLDVEPGASLEEVKRSYRELVKVWHPDRFANDPKLQAKAQEKLKQINLAYERVCEDVASASRFRPTSAEPPRSEAKETAAPSGSSSSSDFRDESRPKATNPSQPPQPAAANQLSGFFRLAGIFIIVGLVRAIWHANHNQPQQPAYAPAAYSEPSPVNQPAQPPVVQPQSESKTRQRLNIEQIALLHQQALKMQPELAKLGMTIQDFSVYFQTNQSKYDLSEGIAFTGSVVGTVGPPVADREHVESLATKTTQANPALVGTIAKSFFTVGATKDEVLAIQGKPDWIGDDTFSYGNSKVRFKDGKVVSWTEYPSGPLKTKNLNAAPVVADASSAATPLANPTNRGFFSVGATMAEVLAVQGEPDGAAEGVLTYGISKVFFADGKVVSWKEYPSSPLKAKEAPAITKLPPK